MTWLHSRSYMQDETGFRYWGYNGEVSILEISYLIDLEKPEISIV